MLMSVYRHNDYDSEDLEEKLIKARYFHDLLHAVGRSHQIKLLLIIHGFIHDKKHPQKTESWVSKTESRGSKTERWSISPTALINCIAFIIKCQLMTTRLQTPKQRFAMTL